MVASTLGVDPTQTGTALSDVGGFALGTTAFDHKGRAFTLIQADGAIDQYAVVTIPSDYDADELDTTNAAASYVDGGEGVALGVAMADIADGSYGWVCRFGTGTDIKVLVEDAVQAGNELYATSTAGQVDDTATGVPARGIRTIADTTTSGSVQAELNWPHTANTVA